MKNSLKKIIAIGVILSILMSLTVFVPVFAAEKKTVDVIGYTEEGMSSAQFSVSNVTGTFDATKVSTNLDAGLIAEAPATVTLLAKNGPIFEAYKILGMAGPDYDVRFLQVSGKVEIFVPDGTGVLDEYGSPKYVLKTIDASELSKYEVDMPYYQPGCTFTLTEPGDYIVKFRYEALAGSAQVMITIKDTKPVNTKSGLKPALKAAPIASKVMVNGKETAFDAYTINGNNYFKLRDLAMVVSGTEKQFGVAWDGAKKAINLVSQKAYTTVGGEMAVGDGKEKAPVLNAAKIYKDGEEVALTAYTINGNNYFKLREIAKAFNIGVTWDSATSTVGIDTSKEYVD